MLRSATASRLTPIWLAPWAVTVSTLKRIVSHRVIRKRAVRFGLILGNVLLLGLVIVVVALNPSRGSKPAESLAASPSAAASQPVDQLASVNIAVTVARMTNLPEAPAVVNQSDSATIQLAVASTNHEVVNKPQAVSSNFVSRKDIHSYVAKAGDTVSGIASQFSVSTDSVLWSNGLTGNGLVAGERLNIPPVNGIVYTVKAGDTPANLASKYSSNEEKIVAYNDAEGGLVPGEQIIIPDGRVIVTALSYSYISGFAWGSTAIYGHNGYDWGNCTWYVATQISVPANWGNAATWAAGARAAGWHVSSVPTKGAIAQTPYMAGGLGHVGIVDDVSPDGKKILLRDMNGIAGFDRVGVAWEDTSTYPNYITR